MTTPAYTPATTAKFNVLSIVSIIGAFLIPLVGIVTGVIALRQIKTTGERGRGLALAGTILGIAFLAIYLIVVVISAIVGATSSSY
ncbi:DUF4190 domain-containing protein [Subtercola sp. YIM 133946]|uniref:DUF4190 domain-containing protein n=1 Tax=Subtercola sp. YIM 133946 TaxID=3118909 RepID=UPI002F91C42A